MKILHFNLQDMDKHNKRYGILVPFSTFDL